MAIIYQVTEEQKDALLALLRGEDLDTAEVLEFVKLVDDLKGDGFEVDETEAEETNVGDAPPEIPSLDSTQ